MGPLPIGHGAVHPPYRFMAIKWRPRSAGIQPQRDQQKWDPVLRAIAL
jgi:hypothetical protein